MEIVVSLITKAAIYAIFILSLNNIVLGKTGYWAVGHLAFFAVGAVTTGVMTVLFGMSGVLIYLSFIISIFLAAIISLIPSFAVFRLRGDFFIFISIALNEIIRVTVESISGPSGFSNIPRPPGLTSDISLMIFVLFIFSFAALYSFSMKNHPLDIISKLLRTHEHSALSFGINVYKIRIKLFILGGALAGAAGSLFAFYSSGSDPQRFNLYEAVMLFALVILGGVDSIRGTVLATIFYVFTIFILESIFSGPLGIYAPKATSLVFGFLLILAINFMPQGITGKRPV